MTEIDLSKNRVTEEAQVQPFQAEQAETVGSDSMQTVEQDKKHLLELKHSLRKAALDIPAVAKSRIAEDIAAVNEKLRVIQMKQLQKEELENVERPKQASPQGTAQSPTKLGTQDSDTVHGNGEHEHAAATRSPTSVDKALGVARKVHLKEKLRSQLNLSQLISGNSAVADVLELHRQRAKQEAQDDGSAGLAYLGAWLDGDGGVERMKVAQELKASQDRLASIERMLPTMEQDIETTQLALSSLDGESEPLQDKLARDTQGLESLQTERATLSKKVPDIEQQLHWIKSSKAYVNLNLSSCGLHGSAVANLLDGLSVSLVSLDLSANKFTSQSMLRIAQSLVSLEDAERHSVGEGKLEVGTLVIDLGEEQESTAVLRVADRTIDVRRWGLRPADQILLGSWFGMAGPQAQLTKLDLSGNLLTVASAQVFAKHIKSSKLQQIVLGHDVPFAVHDTERKMLLTMAERDSTPKIFVETRNMKGQTSSGSDLLSAADAVLLAPIIETLPALEVVSLRGNLDITGATGPRQARQHGQVMAGWNALCESWTEPSVLPNLKKLDLSKCGLNNFALEKLAPVLRRTGAVVDLEELDLSGNDALTGKELNTRTIGAVRVEDLNEHLVSSLWTRGGNILGWKAMLQALTFSKLRRLYVDSCHLGDDAFIILAHAMKNMTELLELSIWRNRLSVKAAEHMGQALCHYGKVNARVKLQRLIFGSDPKRRPVRSGDGKESGLRLYSDRTRELDFSPPIPTEGGQRDGWDAKDLNVARIRGGGRLIGGIIDGFPVYPYRRGDAQLEDDVAYGDGLLLVYSIFTTADNGPQVQSPSRLQSLDLTCIPLNTQAKRLLGEVVASSCLQKLMLVLGSKRAAFDAAEEELDLSSSSMWPDDVYVLTGWLAHNPQVNPKRTTPLVKRLALNHNQNMISDTQLGVPDTAWKPFCEVLGAADIVTVELNATRLEHPKAVEPLAQAMQTMPEVTVLSVKGNRISPDVLTTLESSNRGGPLHRVAFFELHSGDLQ